MKTMLAMIAVLMVSACAQQPEPLSDAQIARNNQGVALMGQYQNEPARVIFAELHAQRPDWTAVRVNEAIATLNRQNEGDERRALEIVNAVLEAEPGHVRATYMAGLIHLYLGEAEPALGYLLAVRQDAPEDAYVEYFTGQAYDQLGQHEAALGAYQRAMELDPYMRSAYYGAALAQRRLGNADAARSLLADYQRFENNPRAHLAEFRYTRKGPLAEALAVDHGGISEVEPMPAGSVFAPPVTVTGWAGEVAHGSLTTADMDGNGAQDLLFADPSGGARVFLQQGDAGFIQAESFPLGDPAPLHAAAWGIPDTGDQLAVLLCGDQSMQLRQRGPGGWAPAPGSEQFSGLAGCRDVATLDADHDGDLDWLATFESDPAVLFSNNLDGGYRRLDDQLQALMSEGGRPARQILTADVDGDRDVDFVVLHEEPPHRVVINDRLWRYRAAESAQALEAASLKAISAADIDADGKLDLIALDESGQLLRWQRDSADQWTATTLRKEVTSTPDAAQLLAQDFTGNGRDDVLVHDAEGFRLYVIEAGQWREAFRADVPLRALQPVLLRAEAGPALAGVVQGEAGAELKIWGAGPGRYSFLAIAPTGRSDAGEGIRSNPSGIGTGVALRVADRWSLVDNYDRNSAPGSSLQPMALGLGGAPRADYVRLYWSDGVLQTEMALDAGEVHNIAENQRQLASCPVLFSWNGERYDFVSDMLGVAGIGFFHGPGRYSTPRPWEYFEFPEDAIKPRQGRYELKISEPMQEIAYLDHVQLHLYDLDPEWGLTLNERMHTGGGPPPDGQPFFYRHSSLRLPVEASNDRGETVTSELTEVDGRAAPPGDPDPRFLGRLAQDHVLTLNFAEAINPQTSRPVLVAHGWVEYPYSQTVFAAWQAGAQYTPPTLEAFADGRWHTVYEQFGYPAGMPREMALPLDDLPAGTTGLRIRSNLQIYWDRIGVVDAQSPPESAVAVTTATPSQARLAMTGFARRDTLPQRRPYYDYADRSPFWDTEYASGYYTALGPVEPLLASVDDAFALVGPGEELHLTFDAPDVPHGRQRIVVLEARGYAKDMDLYTDSGDTVAPLPRTPGIVDPGLRDSLHARYLTRYKAGY